MNSHSYILLTNCNIKNCRTEDRHVEPVLCCCSQSPRLKNKPYEERLKKLIQHIKAKDAKGFDRNVQDNERI